MDNVCCVCALPCQDDNWNGSTLSKYLAINVPVKYSTLLLQIFFNSGGNLISYVSLKEDEVLCRTCIILLKKLYKYQCEIQSIEKMLILQAIRISGSLDESFGIVELPVGWTETFEKKRDGLIYCRKCMFVTEYVEMVEPHLILHSCDSSDTSYTMLRDEIKQTSGQRDSFMDLPKTDNNFDEVSEYLKPPVRTYSRVVVKSNNSSDENRPNTILQKKNDRLNSPTFLQTSDVKLLETQSNMRKTVKLASERTRKCANCGQVIKSIDVCDHTDAKDSMNCEELHCEKCEETFYGDELFLKHMETIHFTCIQCGKSYNSLKVMRSHCIRTHSGFKFPCTECPKVLTTRTGLRYHMQQHAGDVTYNCDYCGRGFIHRKQFKEHLSKHTKIPLYVCEICGQSFIHSRSYDMHKVWHSNPKPYKCNLCQTLFTAQSSVAVHMRRVHTGVKPHKCKQCDEAFVVKGHLRIHMAQKHCGGFPFNCHCCSMGFWKKQVYATHMAVVHNDDSVLRCIRKGKQYKVTVRPDDLQ